VIVPGLDRTPQHGDPPLFAWKELGFFPLPEGEGTGEGVPEEGVSRLLLAPIRESGEKKDAAYDYVRALEREAEDTEAGRLLYVACTRARQRIHLLGCVKLDDARTAKPPNKRSLLAKVWSFASENIPSSPRRGAASGGGAVGDRVVDTLRRLPAGFVLSAPPAPVAWQAPAEGRDAEQQIEFSWATETARHVGTVVHRWLQRVAEDALEGWTISRVEALRSRFQIELRQRGVPPAELDAAANLVSTALRNTITDDRGRWLLGPHPEARSEHRLRDATRRYVIDRVLRDKAGERWIVDYKTSRHEGADIEAFLDRERERHGPQLERYARALGEARLGLYFPLLSGWRDWTVP
jgi:ATP-dependent exoDNAse (exonuclease V) beta subunit